VSIQRILIGCEESGVITTKFREAGFMAFSCDTEPTRGTQAWHFQMDVRTCIEQFGPWSLIVLHPPCTALAVSGNRWYGKGMPRHKERMEAIEWTCDLWKVATNECRLVALENPVSVIFQYLECGLFFVPPVSWVQPWEHGHGETKKTGFAVHGLPRLEPTNVVEGREQRVWKMAPGPNRKRDRSATFPGIADAIVNQWGAIMEQEA